MGGSLAKGFCGAFGEENVTADEVVEAFGATIGDGYNWGYNFKRLDIAITKIYFRLMVNK